MASVTFSIPNDVKEEMKQLSWVNWSELAKQEVMRQHQRAELFKELEELTKDSKLTDDDCLKLAKFVKKRFSKQRGQS